MENNYSTILEDNIERRIEQDNSLLPYSYVLLINVAVWIVFCAIFFGYIMYMIHIMNPDQTSEGLEAVVVAAMIDVNTVVCIIFIPSMMFIVQRINRLNFFITRKKEWYQTIASMVKEQNTDVKRANKLTNLINQKFISIKPISLRSFLGIHVVILSLSMSMIEKNATFVLGIFFIIWIVKLFVYQLSLNNSWNRLQYFESEFDSTLSEIWKEDHKIEDSFSYTIDLRKKRNYFVWLFCSYVSLGIVGIVWDYKMHTDPDNMYKQFHDREDEILEVIEKIEQQKGSEIES